MKLKGLDIKGIYSRPITAFTLPYILSYREIVMSVKNLS